METLMNAARRRRREEEDQNTMNDLSSGRHLDLESNYPPKTICRGLDRASIDMLPIFLVASGGMGTGDSDSCCAVCLCEFQDDEKGRILPLCLHRFHVVCIDLWLASHPTCPVCRGAAMVSAADIAARRN